MKVLLITTYMTLCICQLTASEAVRFKRSIYRAKCPDNSTQEQCETYAKHKLDEKKIYARYGVSKGEIVWYSCGARLCEDKYGKKYRAKEKDLTKCYPDCCPKCTRKSSVRTAK